jgi:hypothetical protein
MKIRSIASLYFLLIPVLTYSQVTVDHWETIVAASDEWKYFPGTADPGANWFNFNFDDNSWLSGPGGFGYGDNDDGTVIDPVLSVFLRKKFLIFDVAELEQIILHVDYDDGFIAYLNGTEIARRNMGTGQFVGFNQPSTGLHEAVLFANGTPEAIVLRPDQKTLLVNGENVIAIQIHNESLASSDLSSSAFISAGLNTSATRYSSIPGWFILPQTVDSSNLPIISIQTNGLEIMDELRIVADMGVIDNGPGIRNSLNDPFNNYNGKISIEFRGESSQMFPKRSFTIETRDELGNNLDVPLLNLPAENDWVLYAPYTDKTMMRDVLAFKLGQDLGSYAPRTRYAELFLNGNYLGVYVLIEKIKIDKNRVDVSSLKWEDIEGDEATGGYLLRVDKIDANDYPAWVSVPSPRLANENLINFQFSDPNGEDLRALQRSYIADFIFKFESALSSSTYNTANGYAKYIDVQAFIDFMIVNEIGKNIDGYIFSTYLHKDKDSKGGLLKMGPLWDFNLAFGNVDYLPNSQFAPGWTYNDDYRMYWFRRLMQDGTFRRKFNCRWKEVRGSKLTNEYFSNTIDSIAILLDEAQQRNYQQWPILGTYVWPNQFIGQTYADEISFLKTWIQSRLNWMDANTVSDCSAGAVTEIEGDLSAYLDVYPNPAKDEAINIHLRAPIAADARIVISGALGEIILDEKFDGEFRWLPRANNRPVSTGIYLIQVKNPRQTYGTQKVVIK